MNSTMGRTVSAVEPGGAILTQFTRAGLGPREEVMEPLREHTEQKEVGAQGAISRLEILLDSV